MAKKILVIIVSLIVTGCAMDYQMKPPRETIMNQHIPVSVFDKTEQGFYTAELVLKPRRNPIVGKGRGHLIIHNHEAVDTPGLDIIATLYMSETGVESSQKPVVSGGRKGLYKVENLFYDSPGMWALELEIRGRRASDVVVLSLPEVKEASEAAPEKEVPIFGLD
jgi:hypothetical protein